MAVVCSSMVGIVVIDQDGKGRVEDAGEEG